MIQKHRHENLTNQELLDRYYLDGDLEWLGILFPRFTMLLYGLCFKYLRNEEEAKDAVQQVFLKAIPELAKYKVTYIKSWLYMIAKNYCLMQLRGSANRPVELTAAYAVNGDEEEEKKLAIEKENDLEALENAISGLNREQQLCITLFYLKKKSYHQVSEETGFSLMQVKSHIQNGKRNLKLILSRGQNER